MSTVIGPAFSLPADWVWEGASSWFVLKQQVAQAVAQAIAREWVASAITQADQQWAWRQGVVVLDAPPLRGWADLQRDWLLAQEQQQAIEDAWMSPRWSARLYGFRDPDDRWYAVLRSREPGLEAVCLAQPGWQSHAYWNNTDDRPEGVDDIAWQARGAAWARRIGASGQLAERGQLRELLPAEGISKPAFWARAAREVALTTIWQDALADRLRRARNVALSTPLARPSDAGPSPAPSAWVRHQMTLMEGRSAPFNALVEHLCTALPDPPTPALPVRSPLPR